MTGMELPAAGFPNLGPLKPIPADTELEGELPLSSWQETGPLTLVAGPDMQQWGGVGMHHYIHNGPCDGQHIHDVSVFNARKWASRSYRMRFNNRVERCAFIGTYPEHDIYWNLAGYDDDYPDLTTPTLIVRNCYSQDAGSQNIQLVQIGENRRFEQGFDAVAAGDWTLGGPIVVSHCLFRNSGRGIDDGNARAAFALSFFESLHDVYVTQVFVDKSMQPRSSGCLLIEKRQKAVVKNAIFLMGQATQPILLAKEVDELVLDSCFFQAKSGQNWIELDGCRKVTIKNCLGTAHVNKDRQDVGLITGVTGW